MEETISLSTPSGLRLAAIVAREAGNNSAPVVVMCHGFSSGKNSKTNKRFTEELLRRGFATFRFDFRGHYDSEGSLEDVTLSTGIEDLTTAMNYVKSCSWVNPNRIGILATSYGGNVSILYVAERNGVSTMALKSPVSDYCQVRELQLGPNGMEEWRAKGYTYVDGDKTKYIFYEDAKSYDTYAEASRIRIPCFITHGDQDQNVPVLQSKKLAEALSGEVRLEVLEGADHQYKDERHFNTMVQLIVDWFSQKL